MDKQQRTKFKQALSTLLDVLPEEHRINTALFLKDKPPQSVHELVSFVANRCETDCIRIHRLFSNRPESIQIVSYFFRQNQKAVSLTAENEYQKWNENNDNLPFSLQQD